MATWFSRTVTPPQIREWVLPMPNDYAQLHQVLHAAEEDRNAMLGLTGDEHCYDNNLMVRIADDEIVVWFEIGKGTTS